MKPKLLTTLKDYSWRILMGDIVAGATVALVALPLSIAIAIASGATPKAGLITAIVGGLLISLLGGSRVQIGGPTGAFIVVVAGVITQFGYDGLLVATFLAGIILVVAGLVRAGRFIALVPEPVIEGFTVGIALIIAVSQLKDLLGLSAHVPADLVHGLPALWAARYQLNLTALSVGLVAIAGIALLRRLLPWFPGSLLVIAHRVRGRGILAPAGGHDLLAFRGASLRAADTVDTPSQYRQDQRAPAVRLRDCLPRRRGVIAFRNCRGPYDR